MAKRDQKDYLGLYRSEAQNHSRTQQSIHKEKAAGGKALHKIKDFLSVNIFGWIYHYLKSRLGTKHVFSGYVKTNGVFEMMSAYTADKNKVKIVLAADWATDTYESDLIGDLMKKELGDYSIHLGDVYFVGAPSEIESNFTVQGASWSKGNSGSLAVPGNHEFYSNGNPFFDRLLPQMFVKTKTGTAPQEASFFCLENDYWRLIGLDTGYYSVGPLIWEWIKIPDAHLDDKLIDWLEKEVKLADDKRGLIILSHHQYCSAFEKQYTKAAEKLQTFIGSDREVIWLWGHEHRFAVYGKYQSKNGIRVFGRCVGHGGMPVEIGKLKSGNECYKEPDPDKAKESNLIFYDKRKRSVINNTILGHNGYVVLNLDSNKLTIEYKDENEWLFREAWELDLKTGKLSGKAQKNPDIDLQLVADSYDIAIK